MNYDFDELNMMIGYFAGSLKITDEARFYEILAKFRKAYGLDENSLDEAKEMLQSRYQTSYWKILLCPDFKEDKVSQTFRSWPLFIKIFQDYPHIMPLYCPNENNYPILKTNSLFPQFENLLYHLKELPFLYVFNDEKTYFIQVDSRQELLEVLYQINQGYDPSRFVKPKQDALAYFIQLSDFHFGSSKKETYSAVLLDMLDEQIKKIHSNVPVKFLITGDLMNSPTRKNMYAANRFINELKRRYHADVQFILGNHDMVVKGFNIFRRQKAKVVAYLLGENVHVLEDVKVVLIKLNSSLHGNFARGKIGERQLQEIDDELSTIQDLDTYTPFVMLHHHLVPVKRADFLKTSWKETHLIGKMMEKSKTLVDSEAVLAWLKKRHIHYVFHGHQHIPDLNKDGNIYMIGSGSSTGIMKDYCDRYLSYNLIQYDMTKGKIISCTLFYEDEKRQLAKHIYTQRLEE